MSVWPCATLVWHKGRSLTDGWIVTVAENTGNYSNTSCWYDHSNQGLLGSSPCSTTSLLWNPTLAVSFSLEIFTVFWNQRTLWFSHCVDTVLLLIWSNFHKKACWEMLTFRLCSKPRDYFEIDCIFMCLKSVKQASFTLCKCSGLRVFWFVLYINVYAVETYLFLELQPFDSPT